MNQILINGFTDEEVLKTCGISPVLFDEKNETGFMITEADIVEIKKHYNFEIKEIRPFRYEGVLITELKSVSKKMDVKDIDVFNIFITKEEEIGKIGGIKKKEWDGADFSIFRGIVEQELSKYLKVPIVVRCPHGVGTSIEKDTDSFYIYFWSTTKTEARKTKIPINDECTIFDRRIELRDRFMHPPTKFVLQIKDDNVVVATLSKPNHLFIHYDICHFSGDNEKYVLTELFRRIINQTLPKEMIEKIEKIRIKAEFVSFNNLFIAGIKRRIEKLGGELASRNSNLIDYTTGIGRICSEIEAIRVELQYLKQGNADYSEKVKEEFNMMTKNEKIDSFKINDNGFEIITKKILCRNPISERVHMIGIIRVTFDIRRSRIKFDNLTQRIDGYSAKMHGPHLFSDGNACLGNIEGDMIKLLQTAELSTLATVTVAFLESVNVEDSAGGLIVKWPLATKEELITDGYKGDENDNKKDKKGK